MYCSHFSMLQMCNDCKYFVTVYCRQGRRWRRQWWIYLIYLALKNLLFWPKVNCHFSYVVEEGPSEEVLGCNERENMDLNMCETLSTCTYIEESVPGPYITINSDTWVEGLDDWAYCISMLQRLSRCSCVCLSFTMLKHLLNSLAKKAKFCVEPPKIGETNVCSWNLGQMASHAHV